MSRVERVTGLVSKLFPRRYHRSIHALSRGLAETIFFRVHGLSVTDFLTPEGASAFREFQSDPARRRQGIYVCIHMGSVELQIEALENGCYPFVVMYQSYKWPPLARLMFNFRSKKNQMGYVPVHKLRDIIKRLDMKMSLVCVADRGMHDRGSMNVMGARALSSLPVRLAAPRHLPIYVGGFYHENEHSFGFRIYRVEPSKIGTMSRGFVDAVTSYIMKNPDDWVCFDAQIQSPAACTGSA